MGIGDFAEAIQTYGVLAVLIAFVLFTVWSVIKSSIETNEKKTEKQLKIQEDDAREKREIERSKLEAERYEKLVNIIVEVVQRGPVHTVEEQERDREIHETVQHYLDCLVKEGADRAFYFTFHNGGKDAMGRGLLKMSMFSESVSRGQHIISGFQNVPRSMLPVVYKKLDESGDYYIKNVEDIQDVDQIVYNFMKGHGAKSAMFRVIKRDDGLMLGYVGVEFNTLDYDFEKQKKNLCKKADRIAGAMLYIKEHADGEEED